MKKLLLLAVAALAVGTLTLGTTDVARADHRSRPGGGYYGSFNYWRYPGTFYPGYSYYRGHSFYYPHGYRHFYRQPGLSFGFYTRNFGFQIGTYGGVRGGHCHR